jgi:histidinol-phosphatase (PHP family)
MKPAALASYLSQVEELQQEYPDTPIYKGLEIDFIPDVISPNDFRDTLDYTIGSIHFVDAYPDGTRWEIDGPHAPFLKGLEEIFHNNIQSAVTRYFELTRQMIREARPDIVGHLDKIKIQNTGHPLFDEHEMWYQDEVINTLDLIREEGCIVEVNTRGLYQKKSATPYPGPWVLERMLEREIPIMLSSDAHHPQDLVNQFAETAVLLGRTGFRKMSTLIDGTWKQIKFNENGILLEHP